VQRYIRIDCFKNLIKILVYFIAYREIKSMAWVMVKVNRNDNAVGLTSIPIEGSIIVRLEGPNHVTGMSRVGSSD